MPDFDTRTRQEPDEPHSRPPSPSSADRARNPPIAEMRWFPIASYALAQIIVVGFWPIMVSLLGLDPTPAFDPDQLDGFLNTAIHTAVLIVPIALVLGVFDAAARLSSRPDLLALDASLIVLFAVVLLALLGNALPDRGSCVAEYECVTITPNSNWPENTGVFIGAELGLVVLMVVSVTIRLIRLIVRRSRRGGS
jgi:hypothetical protein